VNESLRREIKRKAFHLLSVFYIALFAWAPRPAAVTVLGVLTASLAALEAVRLRRPGLNRALVAFFGGIHRESETDRPSGIFWTLLGAFLTVALVPPRDVVTTALWYLALGDAAAALVGRRWGRVRIGAKSLEGSLACFLVCWAAGTLCLSPAPGRPEALAGAILATLLEALPLPFNDNLWIPLVSGLGVVLLRG
jgi:dolichol kinase